MAIKNKHEKKQLLINAYYVKSFLWPNGLAHSKLYLLVYYLVYYDVNVNDLSLYISSTAVL